MCPGCGGHLDDTWDEDAGECSNCGFAYVRGETVSGTSRWTGSSRPGPSLEAAVVAMVVAMMAGQSLPYPEAAETAAGGVAITFSSGNFVAGMALLMLGTLIILIDAARRAI